MVITSTAVIGLPSGRFAEVAAVTEARARRYMKSTVCLDITLNWVTNFGDCPLVFVRGAHARTPHRDRPVQPGAALLPGQPVAGGGGGPGRTAARRAAAQRDRVRRVAGDLQADHAPGPGRPGGEGDADPQAGGGHPG